MPLPRLLRCVAFLACLFLAPLINAQELEEQSLLLTFIPNVQFSPFYIGIAGGYFAEAGYDISIQHLQEPEVVDLVAAGQADFGIVSGEQVILARSQGRDIVTVFEWFQQYPVGVITRGSDSIDDLRGRTVGLPGRFGASYTGLTALLNRGGLTEADIDLTEIGFNAPEVFCLGAVDAAVVYINNEPIQIRDRGRDGDCAIREFSLLPVADHVDLVSNGLITRAELVDEAPEKVAAMVAAMSAALHAAIYNPAHAYLVSLDFVDSLPAKADLLDILRQLADEQAAYLATDPTREAIAASRHAMQLHIEKTAAESLDLGNTAQFEILLRSIALWDAPRLGFSDLESWQEMRDTLAAMGLSLVADLDLEAAFTNAFLPGSDA